MYWSKIRPKGLYTALSYTLLCGVLAAVLSCATTKPISSIYTHFDYLTQALPPTPTAPKPTTPALYEQTAPVALFQPKDSIHSQINDQSTQRIAANLLTGYTLQLYKGFDRKNAESIQQHLQEMGFNAQVSYSQPHYIVQYGFFTHFLQAYAQAHVCRQYAGSDLPKIIILPAQHTISGYIEP